MILDDIVRAKKERLLQHKAAMSEEAMRALALSTKRKTICFYDALKKEGLSVIGEFKKASPSHGVMDNKLNMEDRIRQYNSSVDAISCLTEEDYFHGSVQDLKRIREHTDLPIIRKDFVIDAYQVYEAKVIGADAILLIAAILDDEEFRSLYELAYSLGLDVLCEVHDLQEMQRMLRLGVKIIGINNRNLKTFQVTLETTKQLAAMAPQDTVLVSESGVLADADIQVLCDSRVDAMLIGTALMEAENPEALALHWKEIYNTGRKKRRSGNEGRKKGKTDIKICGITTKAEAGMFIENAVAYCGMVLFYEKSKRNISIEQAKELGRCLPAAVKKTAVVVSPTQQQVQQIEAAGFDFIQIHGNLTQEVLEQIHIPVIRAVNISEYASDTALEKTVSALADTDRIAGVLFDGAMPGSGSAFDWKRIERAKEIVQEKGKLFFLAGGLNKENVGLAVRNVMPDVVDVSSGVEYGDGIMPGKSPERVKEFINAVRAAEAED